MNQKQGRALQGLLVICRQLGAQFTLEEVVARVVQERPDKIHECASAWRELIRKRQVVSCGASAVPKFRLSRAARG
jgi:hypothetical protein